MAGGYGVGSRDNFNLLHELAHLISGEVGASRAAVDAGFADQLDAVRAQGYPEAFIRMWLFYLCYCEGAFRERAISDVLMLWTKPESRLCTT